jgi:hypothetical protein
MDKGFCLVSSTIRYLEYLPLDSDLRTNTISELKTHLKTWFGILKTSSPQDISAFADNNTSQLVFVKESLLKIDKIGFRSFHDKIFTNILKINKSPPTLTTELFSEFIKGITYFQSHQLRNRVPIYHRLMACGPGNEEFRINFNQCTSTMDAASRKDIKKRIETCYIERLLYNEIYKKVELFLPNQEITQNPGHLNWLDETKGDFATCFPNVDIKVTADFATFLKVSKPIEMQIVRTIKGSHKSTTVFKKKTIMLHDGTIIYEPDVVVIKTIRGENNQMSGWFKTQQFAQETTEWKRTY